MFIQAIVRGTLAVLFVASLSCCRIRMCVYVYIYTHMFDTHTTRKHSIDSFIFCNKMLAYTAIHAYIHSNTCVHVHSYRQSFVEHCQSAYLTISCLQYRCRRQRYYKLTVRQTDNVPRTIACMNVHERIYCCVCDYKLLIVSLSC